MRIYHRRARINVKALVILAVVVGTLGVLAFGGHHIRKRVMASTALEQGKMYVESAEWAEACKQFKRYLQQYPDDVEILEQYAGAHLAVRPRTAQNVGSAVGAYERLLRHRPGDDALSDAVAKLLVRMGDHETAIYYCDKRLEVEPNDASASVLKASVLLSRNRPSEAAAILKPLVEQHHPDAVDAYPMLARTALETDDSDAGIAAALVWLDAGVGNNPGIPEVLVARAVFHLDQFGRRKARDAQRARADVEAAELLNLTAPAVTLLMARAWGALGEQDRTAAMITKLDAFDEDMILGADLVPEEFELGRHRVAGSLYRQMDDQARMIELADSALVELTGAYRSAFLPTAIELYALSNRVEEAHRYLDEYRALVEKLTRGGSAINEGLAVLSARVATVDNRPYDVIKELKPVIEWNPRNTAAWSLLAEAYSKTEQDELAFEALQQASARQGGDLAAEGRLARAHFRRGDWSAAIRSAEACERMASGDIEIQLLRIEAALRQESSRPVRSTVIPHLVAELVALQEQHPDVVSIRALLAATAEREKRYTEAESTLRSAMTECSDHLAAARHLAGYLGRRGRSDEAQELYQQAIERDPKRVAPWIAVARYQEASGQREEAQATLTAAVDSVEEPTQRREILRILARLRLVHFGRSEAIASLVALAREDSADVETRLLLLELPEVLDDTEAAQGYIDDVKEIQGDFGLDWQFLQARAWLRSEDWQAHVSDIDRNLEFCIDQKPRWWERAAVARAVMYERLGNDARAEEICLSALAAAPNATSVADRLLAILQRQQRFAEAKTILDRFDRANLLSPQLGAYRLGVAIGTGEYDDAIEELQTRVAADPEAAAERIILARLLYKQRGDAASALKMLNEAETIDANVAGAVAARAAILIAEKRFEDAERVLTENVARREDFAAYLLRGEFYAGRGVHESAERDFRHLTTFEASQAAGFHLLGRFYAKTDQTDRAIEAWEEGLHADPHRTSLKTQLMRVLIDDEDAARNQRGRGLLAELIEELPKNSALRGLHASLLLDEGTPEAAVEARTELKRVIELDKTAVAAHLALVDMDFADGRIDDAMEGALRALEANPDEAVILLTLARLESARGKQSLARDYARAAMKNDPASVSAYVFLIDAALARGDSPTAEDLLAAAERSVPGQWIVEFKRAEILNAAGEIDRAIGVLLTLAERDDVTDPGRISLSLAGLYCKNNDDEKFEFHIREAQRDIAMAPAAARLQMQCLLAQGKADAIAAFVSEYRAEHPDDVETILRGASLLLTTGDERRQREALGFYEQVAATLPNNVAGHFGLAAAAYMLGDTDTVIRGYRGALNADPNNQRALNDLAWVLAETGQPDALTEALALATRGVESYPTDPHLLDTRGVIYSKRGSDDDLVAAVEDLLRAIKLAQGPVLATTRARAMINLADAYIKQGDTSRARTSLQQAQAIHDQENVLTAKEQARITDLSDLCVR